MLFGGLFAWRCYRVSLSVWLKQLPGQEGQPVWLQTGVIQILLGMPEVCESDDVTKRLAELTTLAIPRLPE